MQLRFAPLIALLALLLIALASTRAAAPQRLYLPLQSAARPTETPGPEGTRPALPSLTPPATATRTSTPTATHPATATNTTTATAIVTATATLTATPTQTPVPECAGIYPIGVNTAYLSDTMFINPGPPSEGSAPDWGVIAEGPYVGSTWRRLYVHDTAPGGHTWLRWKKQVSAEGVAATSRAALVASLTPPGNIQLGFEEAPWPNVSAPPQPDVYPAQPGVLNPGDWVWGTPAWKAGSGFSRALDDHIAAARPLILPIYDTYVGNGTNAQYRVVRLGAFVVRGYGRTPGPGQYLELIFVGVWDGCTVVPF